MKKRNLNLLAGPDERIESVTNKYAARALLIVVYYLVISIIIKSFTIDVNIFVYYDYAFALVAAGLYMIYRSASEGVAVHPGGLKVFNPDRAKGFAMISLLFGLFVTFIISGMDDRLTALMPGLWEKAAGALVFGFLFFLLLTAVLWIMDVFPTKMAFRKAAELSGESGKELPDEKEVIKQSHFKDERVDSAIEKYAAHALYFLFVYILLSNMVKMIALDVPMIYYFDAFIAVMMAGIYFTYNILRAGVYQEQPTGKKKKVSGWIKFAAACLLFGLVYTFVDILTDDGLAVTPETIGSKLLPALGMAALFGVLMVLIWRFGKKNAEKLTESD
ncbi:MAG: hypothetical protein LAT84_02430 [Balneolia bacterium]|nr:hypothetical protein [Balneolia bacterium]